MAFRLMRICYEEEIFEMRLNELKKLPLKNNWFSVQKGQEPSIYSKKEKKTEDSSDRVNAPIYF